MHKTWPELFFALTLQNEARNGAIMLKEPSVKMSLIVKDCIAPTLKGFGYRKKNNTWNKKKDQLIYVINVQSSRWNTKDEVSFTINLGVFSLLVDNICWYAKNKPFIAETDCIVRKRLENGYSAGEFWYNISNETNLTELDKTAHDNLVNIGIPFLESIATLNDIHMWLLRKKQECPLIPLENIYLAVVKKILGLNKEGDSILREYEDENNPWKKNIEEISRNFNSWKNKTL
jgi:hypothetical protein